MKTVVKATLMVAALLAGAHASARVTLYEHENFSGRTFNAESDVRNLRQSGYNNQASSAVVENGRWEVCDRPRFQGRCVVLRPGRYNSLSAIGLSDRVSSIRPAGGRDQDDRRAGGGVDVGGAPLTLFEREGFGGRSFSSAQDIENLAQSGFNDLAASAIVNGGPWEVCDEAYHRGRCMTLAPGRYRSLASLGIDRRISSARQHGDNVARGGRQGTPPTTGITLFERENFTGRWHNAVQPVDDLQRHDFSDRASSVIVSTGAWEVCADALYGGGCAVLLPGQYPSLSQMGLDGRISSLRHSDRWAREQPGQNREGAVTFYESENLIGPSFRVDQAVPDFYRAGLYGRARSAEVTGTSWRVCGAPLQGGSCTILRPGVYGSLEAMGLRTDVASLHRVPPAVDDNRWFSGQQPPFSGQQPPSGVPIGRQIR
jgi:hypothetical protein